MNIDAFFAFARERHSVYLRRQAGQPWPWTTDPILQKYRFTNVFRELDATTVWFREHVREPMRHKPEVLLATVLFRWFNRIRTGEAVFCQSMFDKDTQCVPPWDVVENLGVERLKNVRSGILSYCGRGPYVTGAYIIKTPDGYTKLDGVLQCVQWFMEQGHSYDKIFAGDKACMVYHTSGTWRAIAEDCLHPDWQLSLEQMWKWLRQFPYLGDFMAYEVVTDLRHTDLLCDAPDIMSWANPGPGAARGASRVFHDGDKDRYNQHRDKQHIIGLMQELLAYSQDSRYWPKQEELGMMPPEYARNWERSLLLGPWPSWEMREVEHTLCEFDKYERVRTGQGRPRGVYRHG